MKNMYYGAGHSIFERAAELRQRMTSAENIIWKHVHINEWKLKFRRQHPILFYVVDFYCHALKLVIEIDGSIHDVDEVKKKDAEREEALKNLGLTVIRFQNEEVFKHPNQVMKKIDQAINELRNTPSGDGGKQETNLYSEQLKDAYEGDPWFGRSVKALLNEVDESIALKKLNGQHSILELVWHMVTWREFTIHCMQPSPNQNLKSFEELDWRELDHANRLLWAEGLKRLDETQGELLKALQKTDDSILEQIVGERNYNFRKLLAGIIQHDVYHIGQIAFIAKALRNG